MHGGAITAGPGWEWVFFINVPVGIAVAVGLVRVLPPIQVARAGGSLDLMGAALVTAATGTVIYAFINAGDIGWTANHTLVLLGVGAVLYGVLAVWLRAAPNPLIDPRILARRRPLVAGTFVLFVATALMVALFFLGTFYLQGVRGHGPLSTGLMFLPLAVGTMVGAHASGRVMARVGARVVGVSGLLVAAAGLFAASVVEQTAGTIVAASVATIGLGALFVVASVTALSQLEQHQAGKASGVLSTFHELGASSGAAVVSGVVAAGLASVSGARIERGYLVAGVVALIAAAVAALLIPGQDRRPRADTDPWAPGPLARKRRPGLSFARHDGHRQDRPDGATFAHEPKGTVPMSVLQNPPTTSGAAGSHRPVVAFVWHFAEMLLAMVAGMVTLYPAWKYGIARAIGATSPTVAVELLAMATAMTIPMALLMLQRRHRPRLILEMSVAMYAGFVVLFPFLWWGDMSAMSAMGVTMGGHVLMPVFMLTAMLSRRAEYIHHRPTSEVWP